MKMTTLTTLGLEKEVREEPKIKCRLCDLIKKLEAGARTMSWQQQIEVLDSGGEVKRLKLHGRQYFFKEGSSEIESSEIVRYFDDEFVFVNPIKKYPSYKDIMIGMPLQHLTNAELAENPELFATLYQRAIELVKRDYGGDARIMMNQGEKFATVGVHAHIQLIQTLDTSLIVPPIQRKY